MTGTQTTYRDELAAIAFAALPRPGPAAGMERSPDARQWLGDVAGAVAARVLADAIAYLDVDGLPLSAETLRAWWDDRAI